jgi:hypothetical protein
MTAPVTSGVTVPPPWRSARALATFCSIASFSVSDGSRVEQR